MSTIAREIQAMGADASAGRFVIEGALTIRDIESACVRLRQMLDAHAAVEIDCGPATELDLSAIQLFLAARASAQRAGKTLALSRSSAALHEVLSQGGFLNVASAQGETFWPQD